MTFQPTRFYSTRHPKNIPPSPAPSNPSSSFISLGNTTPNTQQSFDTLLTPLRDILIKFQCHVVRKQHNNGTSPVGKVAQFLSPGNLLTLFDCEDDGAYEQCADGDEEDWILGMLCLQFEDRTFVLSENI